MTRKIPKDHKEELIGLNVYDWNGRPIQEIVWEVLDLTADLDQPILTFRWGEPHIHGFRPMNEIEKMQAQARRAASRKANAAKKAKKEAEELALYQKLREKFDVPS